MSNTHFGDYLNISFADDKDFPICFKHEECKTVKSNRILPFANSPVYNSTIVNATQLTKGEDVKIVYNLALDIKDIDHIFEPGDTIGILPCNNENEVEQIFVRLKLTSVASKTYNLCILEGTTKKKPTIPGHIPIYGTLRELFITNLDIRSPPKKLFLKSLARYVTNQEEIEKLQHLCSPEGSQEYTKFITENRSLISLLTVFSSCHPPIAILLENLPPLQPRPYSISSSPLLKTSQNELQITFAVINIDKDIKGICSSWLESITKKLSTAKGHNCNAVDTVAEELQKLSISKVFVPFYFRKYNNFRLPANPTIPIIMIGPGTGIAPFVGFLQHRCLQTEKQNIKFGASWLFYGCRYSDRDFLYKSQIEEFLQNGALTKLFTCYSRESSTKAYIQDVIKSYSKDVVHKIVRENAIVYICGDAKNMAKDVRNTIVFCLADVEGWSTADSESYMKHLQQTNRYIQDVWL